jgi:hypothetical protein
VRRRRYWALSFVAEGETAVDLRCVEGDLLDQDVEVIVNAWNRSTSMGE